MRSGRYEGGFVYLTALFIAGVMGALLTATVQIWSQSAQREKEAELIWIGEQFRQAIGLYYHRSPGTLKRYPKRLEDLIEDRRYLTLQRYLRKIYADPITGRAEWGTIGASDGGIMGVHSISEQTPVRRIGNAARYADWRFVYEPKVK